MPEAGGFWAERDRPGADDARLIAAEELHALRALPYDELRARSEAPPVVKEVEGLSGDRFVRRTAVTPAYGGRELRILIRVDDGTARGQLAPLAEEDVIASPDGEFTRPSTLANQSEERRRYAGIPGWVQIVAAVLMVVAIVAVLLLA